MNIAQSLNKNFESRVRLGIMAILMVNQWVSYKEMKLQLNLTDGNLASHIAALEKARYIEIKKEFLNKKPHTSYTATHLGKEAFTKHLAILEQFINKL